MTLTATSPLKQAEPAQEETPSAVRRPNRRAVMVSAVLTQLMIVLDLTIIAIALPHMQEDLGMTVSQSPWTVTGYSLAFGGLVLFGGRLCAVVGIRRSYQVGLIGFGIASLAAGMATSFPVLLAARVAQGCFGALLAPPLTVTAQCHLHRACRARAGLRDLRRHWRPGSGRRTACRRSTDRLVQLALGPLHQHLPGRRRPAHRAAQPSAGRPARPRLTHH